MHFAFYFESILSFTFISIYNSYSFFHRCILHFYIYITGDIKWMHRYFFHIFCKLCARFLLHCNVYENLMTAFEDNYQTNVPCLMHAIWKITNWLSICEHLIKICFLMIKKKCEKYLSMTVATRMIFDQISFWKVQKNVFQ